MAREKTDSSPSVIPVWFGFRVSGTRRLGFGLASNGTVVTGMTLFARYGVGIFFWRSTINQQSAGVAVDSIAWLVVLEYDYRKETNRETDRPRNTASSAIPLVSQSCNCPFFVTRFYTAHRTVPLATGFRFEVGTWNTR